MPEAFMVKIDIVVSGLGGQGVMTLLQILAMAASKERIPVRTFEGTGITQRGGGVFGFVRLGEAWSPKIPVGEADAILSLELSEVLGVMRYLKPQGQLWANAEKIDGYYTKLLPDAYPDEKKIEALVKKWTPHSYFLPASRLAREAGFHQAVNMVMLGAFCHRNAFLVLESITRAIEDANEKFASSNLEAFWKGYRFIEMDSTRDSTQRTLAERR